MQYDESYYWPHWPVFLKEQGSTEFIVYGTLINKMSASRTLNQSEDRSSVHAFGVRRVFNFVLEEQNYVENGGLYRRSDFENHKATLNVQETGEKQDIVNGVLMKVTEEGFDALAEREAGYDIIPVDYALIDEPEKISNAYMFIARDTSAEIGYRVKDDVLPNESALETCLAGASDFGKSFVDTWVQHCHLADGSRLLDNDYFSALVQKHLSAP
jgi:hypothetical protein